MGNDQEPTLEESPVAPVASEEAPFAPLASEETPVAPVASEEAPVAPVASEEAPVAPVASEEAPVAPVASEEAHVAPVEDVTTKEADKAFEEAEAVTEAKDTPEEAAVSLPSEEAVVSPPSEEKKDTEDNAAAVKEEEAPKEIPSEPDHPAETTETPADNAEEVVKPMETDDKPMEIDDKPALAEEETKPEAEEVKPEQGGEEPEDDAEAIWEPAEADVLSGRGASVNAHGGNKKFRALCFCRKPEFDAGNHAAKRRIATEIVAATTSGTHCRFLKKKKADKGAWFEMNLDQAILKACQVMRDYKRPDRLAIREMMAQNGSARKRQRTQESTPMIDIPIPTVPLEPIIENPFGVHDHDILSGRGAFVNGHIGNNRLRTLALERKIQFDSGNYTEKRALATEIVSHIRSLDPPGRFLKRVNRAPKPQKDESGDWILPPRGLDGTWEELNDEKAIHKACQVMRDIDRPDRKDREVRRRKKLKLGPDGEEVSVTSGDAKEDAAAPVDDTTAAVEAAITAAAEKVVAASEEAIIEVETQDDKTKDAAEKAVEEAVAAVQEGLDSAMEVVVGEAKPAIEVTGSVQV